MAGNPVATFGQPTVIVDGATQVIDCSSGSSMVWTMGASRTCSAFVNPVQGQILYLEVRQDATGSRIMTWPSNVNWPAATAPTLTTTASKRDKLCFIYNANNTWDGYTIGLNYT